MLYHQVVNVVISRLLPIALVLVLSISAGVMGYKQFLQLDPYVQTVFSLSASGDRGRAIFEMNCAGCHGWEARGNVGPTLQGISQRRSRRQLIDQVIGGKTPPMPQFQPTAQEMADLLSYLEQL